MKREVACKKSWLQSRYAKLENSLQLKEIRILPSAMAAAFYKIYPSIKRDPVSFSF